MARHGMARITANPCEDSLIDDPALHNRVTGKLFAETQSDEMQRAGSLLARDGAAGRGRISKITFGFLRAGLHPRSTLSGCYHDSD